MSSRGFFTVDRAQFAGDDLLWDDNTAFDSRSAWLWLYQAAAWKDGEYRTAGHTDTLKRGEFVASIRYLAQKFGWDKNRVTRFLDKLTKAGRIARQRAGQHGTVYLIVNYELTSSHYPSYGTHTETPSETETGHSRDTDRDTNADKVEQEKQVKKEKHTSHRDVTAGYSADFETLWSAYPKRSGSNSKAAAYRQFSARLKQGVTFETMLAGVKRYAAYVTARGMMGTELVKMAATFLGRDRHFEETYNLPMTTDAEAPEVSRARSLYTLYVQHGFTRVQPAEAYKEQIKALADAGTIGEPRRFWAELQQVRPWTWMPSIRAEMAPQAIRRIADGIRGIGPILERSVAA